MQNKYETCLYSLDSCTRINCVMQLVKVWPVFNVEIHNKYIIKYSTEMLIFGKNDSNMCKISYL